MVVQSSAASCVQEINMAESNPTTSKKFLVVKNHVREVEIPESAATPQSTTYSSKESYDEGKNQQNIKRKVDYSDEVKNQSNSSTDEERRDFEELRDVFYKCKKILKKIEVKYGDKLNLTSSSEGEQWSGSKRLKNDDRVNCTCDYRFVTLYDNEGNKTNERRRVNSQNCILHYEKIRIMRESETEAELSDNMQALNKLLQNECLPLYERSKINRRISDIRAENTNNMRYSRNMLLKGLKDDPNNIFEFEGANLSSIDGYGSSKN